MIRLALLFTCVGCVTPDQIDTGPTVRVGLQGSASPITNESTDPAITLRSTETMYEIDFWIETRREGEHEQEGSFDSFPLARVEVAVSVPDHVVPALMFDSLFKATAPIALPASAKGKRMHVTARGFDSRGLSSNVVDFDVALR